MVLSFNEELQALVARKALGWSSNDDLVAFAHRVLTAGLISDELIELAFVEPWPSVVEEAVNNFIKSVNYQPSKIGVLAWLLISVAEEASSKPLDALSELWNWLLIENEFSRELLDETGASLLYKTGYDLLTYVGEAMPIEEKNQAAQEVWQRWNGAYGLKCRGYLIARFDDETQGNTSSKPTGVME